MRLIALLNWFDERTDWLTELVASMARAGVDHVVAVDGAYGLYPQARGSSGSDQARAVIASALGAGIGVTVHVPQEAWAGNEVEKRSFLFAAAHLVAEPGKDWLWVCDGDEVITNAAGLRGTLERAAAVVGEVILWERAGDHEAGHSPARRLFLAHSGGIRVEHRHCRYVNGDGAVLWDAAIPVDQVEAEPYWDVRVEHRAATRDAYRNMKRNEYCERRELLGAEAG